MTDNVKVTSKAVKRLLRSYSPELAFSEYVWNGFDAKATTVKINYKCNELDNFEVLEIEDNGYGIDFDKLSTKFNPFFDSEKAIDISGATHSSATHGKNGVGRLTFFKFANSAKWTTFFKREDKCYSGSIDISSATLNSYTPSEVIELQNDSVTGTKVSFFNVEISHNEFEKTIIPHLISEFCWFLQLNRNKNYSIIINGSPLDYSNNIVDIEEKIEIIYEKSDTKFTLEYIQWKENLGKEFSKIYFQNSKKDEVYKDFTTLNKKGDEFYHSIFIESDFFDDFNFNSTENDTQETIFGKAKSSPEYKFLIKKVNEYLRKKRKPFLKIIAHKLIEKYEQEGVFPTYNTEWETAYKKPQLEETIIGLYEAQPKLFSNKINLDQKKTFVRFLDLLLDSNERDRTFKVLEEIIELDPEERQDLAELFKTTRLNAIINTIKLLQDRYQTISYLKDLVFNHDLNANEVDHLQKVIENHYWIFGEQYHLITAAEPKFEEALRRYLFHLTEKDVVLNIQHPHKLKEMDIFACRQNILTNKIENIVVELKHPLISLGEEQYAQVHKYLQVISSQPEFNASNMFWEFYLVGAKFNTSNFIQDMISSNKNHGISSLILFKDDGRIKVYAKTWSEIFADFEMTHNHLNEKLKMERNTLANKFENASEVVESVQNNSAIRPKEISMPSK